MAVLLAEKVEIVKTRPVFSLFRKELIESRMLILWTSSTMAAIFIAAISLICLTAQDEKPVLGASESRSLLVGIWFFSAALAGSSTVSPEIGSGSLQFLSSLPLARKRLWYTKVLTSLAVHALSMAAATAVFYICNDIACWVGSTNSHSGLMEIGPTANLIELFRENRYVPFVTLSVFSVGCLGSVFTDRTLGTFFVTAIAAISAATVLIGLASSLEPGHIWFVWAITATISLLLLRCSYSVFAEGETLRTTKRFFVLAKILVSDVLPILISIAIAWIWISL